MKALEYHERTKHSEERLRRGPHSLDWANQPLPFKIYPELEPTPLPLDYPLRELTVFEALAAPPSPSGPEAQERIPDLASLARVLHLSAGITKRIPRSGG